MSVADEITRLKAAKADLKAVIEANGGSVGDGLIDTYAPQVAAVYGAGYAAGKAQGDGFYDTFWDTYQQNGERTAYAYAFAGGGWTDECFKPKYDIAPKGGCSYMFNTTSITDIKNIGVDIDFSGCTDVTYLLSNSALRTVGVLDMTGATTLGYIMYNARSLESIDKFILKADGSNTFNNLLSFGYCYALTHCPFEGVIGQGDFDMHWSTSLDKESLTSIINCLSPDTQGLTVTLSKTAVNTAFETGAGAADGAASSTWQALIATKPGWQVDLK